MSGRRMSGTSKCTPRLLLYCEFSLGNAGKNGQEPELPDLAWKSQMSFSQTSATTRCVCTAFRGMIWEGFGSPGPEMRLSKTALAGQRVWGSWGGGLEGREGREQRKADTQTPTSLHS